MKYDGNLQKLHLPESNLDIGSVVVGPISKSRNS
jgi:hypothetical protein